MPTLLYSELVSGLPSNREKGNAAGAKAYINKINEVSPSY